MQILHLIPALDSGGVETGTIDLARTFKKSGHNIIVISNGGRLVSQLERAGVIHIKLPLHKKSLSALFLAKEIAGIIEKHNIEIVHASSRVPAWIGFFASKCTKTPFVTSCHGFYSKHFFSKIMGMGDLVIVISKSVEERMVNDFGVPKDKIRLVYRGLDIEKYPYNEEKYEKEKKSFVVTNIGRLTPIKGHAEFIRAIKLVSERVKSVEAWIVGRGESGKENYVKELKGIARDLGISENVKFLGERSDIPEILRESDCLVLSSIVPEGFGRTIVEAGAIGTAVAASNIGGVREIVDSNVSGILFSPESAYSMAEAITTLLKDNSLSKKYAENLRKKVETTFTLEKMADRTLAVYREAIEAR